MKKTPNRSHLLDKLHRGFVISCIGMTAYGTYLLGLRVHRYFTVIRPARQAKEMEMIQEGLSVGPSVSSAGITTKDSAPELRV